MPVCIFDHPGSFTGCLFINHICNYAGNDQGDLDDDENDNADDLDDDENDNAGDLDDDDSPAFALLKR